MNSNHRNRGSGDAAAVVIIIVLVLLALPVCLFGCPHYMVWQKQKQGEGELAQAESNRKIATLEAEAKKDSAKMLAEAEVIRARGVAEANQIIGKSLAGNESYLRYLWITGLNTDGVAQVIYVPTEGSLPILEAGRRPPVAANPTAPQ